MTVSEQRLQGLQMFRDIDDADVTFSGRVFNSRAAATKKARSPMVERLVLGTTSDDVDAERRRWRASSADDWWSSSARYGGAVWYWHLYTKTASLNSMHSSQFSCVKSSVMRSQRDAENTSHTQLCGHGLRILRPQLLLAKGYQSPPVHGPTV